MGIQGNNVIINNGTIDGTLTQTYCGTGNQGDELNRKQNYKFKYDVAVSYSSIDEKFVKRVVKILKLENINVFFAPMNEKEFLSKDMMQEFYKIYRYQCLFVAAFISESYLSKEMTMHEAETAILREEDEDRNCLIPIYLCDKS